MDPLYIVTAVLSSALAVQRWIRQKQTKNKVIAELSNTVDRVYDILSPLHASLSIRDTGWNSQTTTLLSIPEGHEELPPDDLNVVSCLLDTGEALSVLKEHLTLWKEKSLTANVLAFLTPQTVIGRLQEDGDRLQQRLNLLSFALQVSTYRTGQRLHRTLQALSSSGQALSSEQVLSSGPSPLDFIKNPDVGRFWREQIGLHVSLCS
ncbi:hypothetical protein OBBRIDRAFT_410451 [Obba rivulosa]|uniref:Uncharacterized protein n=1 Tax=Obba rivulosa TaxID=1052685 RepID=A0A8E2DP29_9APHY|nr:hypothetical protein OBBRIDRAFT_410451 [Obba rivulosa]